MGDKSLGPNFFWSPGTTRPRRICDWLETIMHMTRSITDVKSTWLQYNSLTFTSSKQTDQPIISSFDYWRGEHVDKTPQQPHFHWFKTNWPTNHKQYNSVKRGKGNESIVGRAATGCYTVEQVKGISSDIEFKALGSVVIVTGCAHVSTWSSRPWSLSLCAARDQQVTARRHTIPHNTSTVLGKIEARNAHALIEWFM